MFPVKLLYDFNNASTSSRGFPPSYREANISAPCKIEGAVPCLWTIRQTVTSLKGNIFPYLTSLTLRVLKVFSAHKLPFKFLSWLMMKRALCLFTSLSGSTATLYICGRRVQNLCMWYPVTPDVILSSSLMTYSDECRICVELWEDCGIDPHELVKECQRQIEILMELMKNRQIPKRRRSVFYDDVDLDDLDLNCGDEVQDDTASAHVTKHMTKLFIERSKVDSMANGTGGNFIQATAASENEVDDGIDHYQLQDIPSVSKEAYLRDIDELPHRLSKDGQSTHPPTSDFEVGIEISPPVERRNSAALL
ncbi:uncharacterized protein [Apostichopus japonicus]|uniref:uncharacterized protein n=1 Tax=Stichopus japonicus TaxID=307972 RepID=UPI003AB16C96